jgi:hypothetical protein
LGKNEIFGKELSHSWTDYWMIIQTFYTGLNFSSRNLLDLAAGGTFMSIILGAATKLLDDMMINYFE